MQAYGQQQASYAAAMVLILMLRDNPYFCPTQLYNGKSDLFSN